MRMKDMDAPAASSPPVAHADWLELQALLLDDMSASHSDLVAELRRAGTAEVEMDDDSEYAEVDEGSEATQAIADAVFAELEDRAAAAGNGYPFGVDADNVTANAGARESLYTFLLCLSFNGDTKASIDPRRLFEDVSAAVLAAYMGTGRQTSIYQFGFPRRLAPKDFVGALDDLCHQLNEGLRARPDIAIAADQKDATLDLVAWKPFPDRREGSLMAFAQCAAGANWPDKTTEMQPESFSKFWMDRPLLSIPTRLFLLPYRVEPARWELVTSRAGLILDRCRIAWLAEHVPADVLDRCRSWTAAALTGATAA